MVLGRPECACSLVFGIVAFYPTVMIVKFIKSAYGASTQKYGMVITRDFEMSKRDRIIMEITDAFFDDLRHLDENTCFEFSNPEYLKNLATLFIAQKAEDLSDEDILTEFGDSSQLLDEWLAFLKTRLETLGKTIH